ncbi:hypothetical protein Y032_0241g3401 [Ancylostoma ceylanicum]|uniref:Uncharacterized protein n=1 Tax=Ancylostoma ceylanicum TaxID=53326 RepID=A0A016SEN4_9BILA|nr:hypothetical protein Y032_0241g3401 [Ancylostoma ceylanicum]
MHPETLLQSSNGSTKTLVTHRTMEQDERFEDVATRARDGAADVDGLEALQLHHPGTTVWKRSGHKNAIFPL